MWILNLVIHFLVQPLIGLGSQERRLIVVAFHIDALMLCKLLLRVGSKSLRCEMLLAPNVDLLETLHVLIDLW